MSKPILITCQEIWKDLENFPGYQVSTLGNVKSINNASFITNIPRKTIEYALKHNKTIKELTLVKNTTKTLEEIL